MIRRCGIALGLLPFAVAATGAPLEIDDLLRPIVMHDATVSPSGAWVAYRRDLDDEFALVVHSVDTHAKLAIRSELGFGDYWWVGRDMLVVEMVATKGTLTSEEEKRSLVVHPTLSDEGSVESRNQPIRLEGRVVDPLPHLEGKVLWEQERGKRNEVFRVELDRLTRSRREQRRMAPLRGAAASFDGEVISWVADHRGAPRAALVRHDDEEGVALWYSEGARIQWRVLERMEEEEDFLFPLAMAADGVDLLVAARAGQDTLGLHEYRVATREIGEALYVDASVDVQSVVWDYSGTELLAAVPKRQGEDVYHYFDAFRARYQQSLERAFPDQSVHVIGASADQKLLLLAVADARNPGEFYLLDTSSNQATLLGAVQPGLDREDLTQTMQLEATSADGTQIEAFLTRPDREDPVPLVVMPHGGPIGVRDDRNFDPMVQYLASAGMAVLKVNYRGSWGYGKAFLDAGRRAWATGIEDDIDAAVRAALDAGGLDNDRICIAGASYGGYSALMSTIRHPTSFRCAVSLAGPTDLLYMFASSDFAATRSGRTAFMEIVGDPATERERLMEISPVYQAATIRTPLLLAHGTIDQRVDIDHAHRLMGMLDLLGTEYEWYPIPYGWHSLRLEQHAAYAERLREFLAKHLDVPVPARAPHGEQAGRIEVPVR